MTFGWQDITVAVLCLAAAAYVGRAIWKSIAGRSSDNSSGSCGTGCGKCAANQPKPVLQIESPRQPPA